MRLTPCLALMTMLPGIATAAPTFTGNAPAELPEGAEPVAVAIQQPSFPGTFEDVDRLTDWAHSQGALVIAIVNPTSLALLKAPGHWGSEGADIAIGEGVNYAYLVTIPWGIGLAIHATTYGYSRRRAGEQE